ncbi:MAG: ATP-dependent ligase [Actinomycetia bacterium]|nr:ATP-dependent ligase [Actinomycetes bacterium]
MLAKLTRDLPTGPGFLFEPKWDGFRAIVFRDGDDVEITSRNTKPLTRYFPELVDALRANLPDRIVLDGEIVVVTGSGLDFDSLSLRVHPAASRIKLLAVEIPASFVAFDLLALGDDDLRERPFGERRAALEAALASVSPPVHLTPASPDVGTARDWFQRFEGAGFDGVIAKPTDLPYAEDKRVLFKVKHERTADCVVAGYRMHKDGKGLGSLLLGLYDERGALHHVGVASSFTAVARKELLDFLEPYRSTDLSEHPWADWARASVEAIENGSRMPGGQSRWSAGKDLSWEPLRPELVAEVAYEHVQRTDDGNVSGGRFRHTARFQRWRPDRDPGSCTYEQLDEAPPAELQAIFAVTPDS